MRGMLQLRLSKALVVIDSTVADELDLGLARNSLQIGMKDGLLRLSGLVITVTIAIRLRVEGLQTASTSAPC